MTERVGDAPLGGGGVVARNAAARTGGEIVAKLASVVFFVAVARVLGEQNFGDFMFAVSFTAVLFIVSGFGTDELMAREVSRDRERVHAYLSNVVAVKAVMSVLLFGLAYLVMVVGDYPSDVRAAVFLVGLGACLENFGRTWAAVFQAWERMEFISVVLILQRILTAAGGAIALALGGGLVDVSAVYAGATLVGFLVGVLLLRGFIVRPNWRIDTSRWVPIIKAGVPIGLLTLLFSLLLRLDQTLISYLSGGNNREVGFYAAAFRLVEATLFVSWSFSQAMLPWLARGEDAGDRAMADGYEMGQKALAAVLTPVAVIFVLLADPIVSLVYGADYSEAVPSLQLLGAMTLFFGINGFAAMALIARDRPGLFSRSLIAMIVLNVALNVILIPPMGATGAALAALISGVALAALAQVFVGRAVGRVNPVRSLGTPLLAGAASALAIVATGQQLVVSVAVGSLVYLVALIAAERLLYPEDFARFRSLLRHLRPTPPSTATPRPETG
jgi:O-antigen/teichoic acid export membrane protein